MLSETQAAQASMNEAARLMRLATYASVGTALSLIVLKLGAWVLTDSISLLSTLIDSILDAVASLVSLLAVRTALTPADREHRFGHGKAEPLAALGQAAFITGSAVFLLIEALQKYHHYYGESLTVEFPTGSGNRLTLDRVAHELSQRLVSILPECAGQ